MNKILLVVLFSYAKILNAQVIEERPFKYFGFQAGANISNMNFNLGSTAPDTTIASSWKAGFTFGFILQIPLAKKFSLEPEYSFTRRYGADNSLGIDFRMDYLSMPVLVKYQFFERFALLAGPQFELLINARSTNRGENTDITHQVEERSVGIAAGLEVQIVRAFFVSARYIEGFNNIGIWQRASDVKEFKYQLIIITAGIRF